MATPRFERPTYFMRSRAGEVLGPFTLQEVIDQLAQRKITNDGEIRRQGWEILEKDELWGRVRDFPVFGHSGPAGRQELHALKVRARKALFVGGALLLAALALFVTLFFLPYQEAQEGLQKASELTAKAKQDNLEFQKRLDAEVAVAKKQWNAEFDQNLKKWEADLAVHSERLAQSRADLKKAEDSIDAQKLAIDKIQDELKSFKQALDTERKQHALTKDKGAESARMAQELRATFDERLKQAEARLNQEFQDSVRRNTEESGDGFMKKPKNPRMGYVLLSRDQDQNKLVLLVSNRPEAGTRLRLYDGDKSLHVTVSKQGMGPPYLVVDVEPDQPDSASRLAFLGTEVLIMNSP